MPSVKFQSRELRRFGKVPTQFGIAKQATEFDRDYLSRAQGDSSGIPADREKNLEFQIEPALGDQTDANASGGN
jgi:hypothetical protein